VLYFGSIDPERKIDFLLQIIAQVKNSIPNIFLLIIGGENEDIHRLRVLSSKLAIDKNIYFLQQQPRMILFSLLKKS